VDHLASDIEFDYANSIRKSIVDYILSRPAECVRLGVPHVEPRKPRPALDTSQWREAVFMAMDTMENGLFITNPVMVEILGMWQQYVDLSLACESPGVLASETAGHGLPCQLSVFQTVQTQVSALLRAFSVTTATLTSGFCVSHSTGRPRRTFSKTSGSRASQPAFMTCGRTGRSQAAVRCIMSQSAMLRVRL
jgi:hypothetical protein